MFLICSPERIRKKNNCNIVQESYVDNVVSIQYHDFCADWGGGLYMTTQDGKVYFLLTDPLWGGVKNPTFDEHVRKIGGRKSKVFCYVLMFNKRRIL